MSEDSEKQLIQLLLCGSKEQKIYAMEKLAEMQSLLAVFPIAQLGYPYDDDRYDATLQEASEKALDHYHRTAAEVGDMFCTIVEQREQMAADEISADTLMRPFIESHTEQFSALHSVQIILGGVYYASTSQAKRLAVSFLQGGEKYCFRELFNLLKTNDVELELTEEIGRLLYRYDDNKILEHCFNPASCPTTTLRIFSALIIFKHLFDKEMISFLYDGLYHDSSFIRQKSAHQLNRAARALRTIELSKVKEALDLLVEKQAERGEASRTAAILEAKNYYVMISTSARRLKSDSTIHGVLSSGKPKPPKGKGNIHRVRRVGLQ